MAAPAHPRGLGLPRSTGDDHGAAIYFAISREALQLWLSGVPEPRRSGGALGAIEAGRDRHSPYGGLHDGSGSERECIGVSPSGLHLLFRGGCRRILAQDDKPNLWSFRLPFAQRPALLMTGLITSIALSWGCSGIASGNSSTQPPPTQAYNLSGTISPAAGGNAATVTLSGAASAMTTANSSGSYTFTGLANGTYAITPSHTGYTFSPTSQTATVSAANVTGINFTDIQQSATYTISGTISPAAGGNGATVILSGAAGATTVANASGSYSFSGLANGTYTVTPRTLRDAYSLATEHVR